MCVIPCSITILRERINWLSCFCESSSTLSNSSILLPQKAFPSSRQSILYSPSNLLDLKWHTPLKGLTILDLDYKECSDYTKKKWNFKLELSILNERQTNTTAHVTWKCWKLPNGHTQLGKILGLKNYHFLKGFSPVLLSSFDSTQDLIQVCYLWTQNCTYFTEGTNMLPSSMECISESSGSSPPDIATTWPQTQQRKQRVTN